MQVYIYPEIRCFYLKMHIGVEELLSRDNPEFSVTMGTFRIDVYYKRTVPAHLYSFFPCIFLSFLLSLHPQPPCINKTALA